MNPRTKFLYLISQLITYCEKHNIEIIVFTFYRDTAQQYQEFVKGKSKIAANGPHQKWTAMDIAILENGLALFDDKPETIAKYRRLADFWKTLDPKCIWGGDFQFAKDVYHFELK